jgi:hypothetical protein
MKKILSIGSKLFFYLLFCKAKVNMTFVIISKCTLRTDKVGGGGCKDRV